MSIWLVLALLAGGVLPAQAAINARLGKDAGSPVFGALASFAVGSVGLALYLILAGGWPSSMEGLGRAPWWAWIGGLLGALYVTVAIMAVPRLGVATLTVAAVAGQMAVSIVLDHFGLLGLKVQPVSVGRAAGALLVIGGVLLIKRT